MTLWRLGRLLPEVPRALLASKEKDPSNKIYLRNLWFAPYVGVHALHLDHNYVSERELKNFCRREIPVSLWTVNEKERARVFFRAGALSIISDELVSLDES